VWLITEIKLGGDNLRICPKCHELIGEDANHCFNCRFDLTQIVRLDYLCKKCGAELQEERSVCTCGGKAIRRDEYSNFRFRYFRRKRKIKIYSVIALIILLYVVYTIPKSFEHMFRLTYNAEIVGSVSFNETRYQNGQFRSDHKNITLYKQDIMTKEFMDLLGTLHYRKSIKSIFPYDGYSSSGGISEIYIYFYDSSTLNGMCLIVFSDGTIMDNSDYYNIGFFTKTEEREFFQKLYTFIEDNYKPELDDN
jgi:hypothetical protein